MSPATLGQKALALVNAARAAAGLPVLAALPDGIPGDPHANPVARALPMAYKVWHDRIHAKPGTVRLLRTVWGPAATAVRYDPLMPKPNRGEAPHILGTPQDIEDYLLAYNKLGRQ
jgi:hypothetical protein